MLVKAASGRKSNISQKRCPARPRDARSGWRRTRRLAEAAGVEGGVDFRALEVEGEVVRQLVVVVRTFVGEERGTGPEVGTAVVATLVLTVGSQQHQLVAVVVVALTIDAREEVHVAVAKRGQKPRNLLVVGVVEVDEAARLESHERSLGVDGTAGEPRVEWDSRQTLAITDEVATMLRPLDELRDIHHGEGTGFLHGYGVVSDREDGGLATDVVDVDQLEPRRRDVEAGSGGVAGVGVTGEAAVAAGGREQRAEELRCLDQRILRGLPTLGLEGDREVEALRRVLEADDFHDLGVAVLDGEVILIGRDRTGGVLLVDGQTREAGRVEVGLGVEAGELAWSAALIAAEEIGDGEDGEVGKTHVSTWGGEWNWTGRRVRPEQRGRICLRLANMST